VFVLDPAFGARAGGHAQPLADAVVDPFAKQVGMTQVLGVLPDHVHQNLTHWHRSSRAELTRIRDTAMTASAWAISARHEDQASSTTAESASTFNSMLRS
jgi:hypothetical protein